MKYLERVTQVLNYLVAMVFGAFVATAALHFYIQKNAVCISKTVCVFAFDKMNTFGF